MEEVKEEKIPISIKRAQEAAERLEAANKKHEELLDREESLRVERTLGGRADASPTPPKKEETPQEYAKRIMQNG
jgi:hypothetical protein